MQDVETSINSKTNKVSVDDNSSGGSTVRLWMAKIALVVLAPIFFFGAVELGLRLAGVGYSTDLTQPCTIHGQPASCYNLFFPAPFFPRGVIKTPQVYAVPTAKAKNTFRVFVLGESAAMGDPDPAYSFSRYLKVMLKERFPDTNFEIYNTGIVAINSHVLLPMAEDLAKLQPDLFIIYAGNNEVVGPYGSGTVLTASGMSRPMIRSSIFLHSTRIGQLVTNSVTPKKQWGGMEMFLQNQVAADSPRMQRVYANFQSNLLDMVAAARASGAKVILSTVATNLKDCGPFASQHRANLTPQELQKWNMLVQQASELEDARSFDEAMKLYTAAAQIDDQYAELEFRIARCRLKMDDFPGARQHFTRARDLDTLRFRADTHINEIIRSVASSAPGVQLVDAESILSQLSANGIIGRDLVFEHVHLTPLGNYLLARAIYPTVASEIAGHPVSEDEAASEAECERLLALTGYDHSRLAEEMLQRLQRPPFTNQLDHSQQLFRMMLDAQPSSESPEETAEAYRLALSKDPDDRTLHYRYGLFLANFDTGAATQELKLSQPWDGFPVFAPDGTQIQ